MERMRNPVERAKAEFDAAVRPIRRRITYCAYRMKRVGAIKVKRKWLREKAAAAARLSSLQKRTFRELGY